MYKLKNLQVNFIDFIMLRKLFEIHVYVNILIYVLGIFMFNQPCNYIMLFTPLPTHLSH